MSSLENLFRSLAAYNEDQIRKLTISISKFPQGKLRHYKNGSSVRYVLLCEGQKPKTIPKHSTDFIKTMTQKAVFEARKEDCEADLKLCMQALNALKGHPDALEKLLADPHISGLLSHENLQADLLEWQNAPYDKNPNYPENLTVPTEAGINVRSKDEALCVSAIMDSGFPFRYEQKLTLKGRDLYPDFTLLHPTGRRIIIMEVFGMMDDAGYARKTGRKLQLFLENGYIPGYNLLCFFASAEKPLDITEIMHALKQL